MEDVNLDGVIDLHVHTAPDIRPRIMNDVELARAASEAGMKALLLKSHHTLTADRAQIAEMQISGTRIFGGLVLNDAVGGLNPAAVEAALAMGAREIWMPTLSAANHFQFSGVGDEGISILNDSGSLKTIVFDILEMIAQEDRILGTGHLSVEEILILVKAAREMGVRYIIVTHPELPIVNMPLEVQQELAGPDLFFERCLISVIAQGQTVTMAQVAEIVHKMGAETTVLATDLGQPYNPSPIEGMRYFIEGMMDYGISNDQINLMTKVTPGILLGLD